ncbi:hypothetical protein EDB81DRAFT_764944 [Dactylonectria macrodidyma]|uniref:Uncharacterized protein n=1 Tax=Dactylonectria macrodidyma TaxID=307937 RepID=A0A9P9DUX7_9HYPO|nr:hypothetical protein EDB81DRAFT_764944 [Dactylonectria macrodidyma]
MFQNLLRRLATALYGPSTQETTTSGASAHPPVIPVQLSTVSYANTILPPASYANLVLPPPPYASSTQEWRLIFHCCSEPENPPASSQTMFDNRDWFGILSLRTRDLPGLMKQGLYLSQDHVQQRNNYLKRTPRPGDNKLLYSRIYPLIDSTWTGQLRVAGWNVKPLSEFRIAHLLVDHVVEAMAFDQNENVVYYWNTFAPETNFNMIYDDMALDGLWPWPRESKSETEGQMEDKKMRK